MIFLINLEFTWQEEGYHISKDNVANLFGQKCGGRYYGYSLGFCLIFIRPETFQDYWKYHERSTAFQTAAIYYKH